MSETRASVVVVSRGRSNELAKCLKALRLQFYPNFEIVVVADQGGCAVVSGLGLQDHVKTVPFGEPNISAARNLGINHAAGEIVAFIDDDAIAEPTWLKNLTAPFVREDVAAAGGFVRGRNGISFQWKGELLDCAGQSRSINVEEMTVIRGTAEKSVKTQGTNCAFRRELLERLGGFDESYAYFMDETDLNLRIGAAGHSTAIVPDAEVQHLVASNSVRGSDRAPKSLYQIGASYAYFLRKQRLGDEFWIEFAQQQRGRLLRAMVAGQLEPRDVFRLMQELEEGRADGRLREHRLKKAFATAPDFKPAVVEGEAPQSHVISGRFGQRKKLYTEARRLATQGRAVTVFCFWPNALFHKRWFHPDGFWVQSGGIFGKSSRSDPLISFRSRMSRIKRELNAIRKTRGLGDGVKIDASF
ncbi:MAG: glycosyltransferase [Litoreibacter sp.]|nr:glycosyltransferase [Litoreibacter sp.]